MENYYQVLGATMSCSRDELKQKYHTLIREYHPDKGNAMVDIETFHLIDEAWKVLSDDRKRQEYDAKLKASEICDLHPVHEEITMAGMDWNSNLNLYERNCRCGGKYVIEEEDISSSNDLLHVNCDSCSLSIIVDSGFLSDSNRPNS